MTDVVTVGWLTVDDIVLLDGTCRKGVLGGGALYSAVGARMFAESVAIHSVCGKPYADRARAEITARGIDPSGIVTIDAGASSSGCSTRVKPTSSSFPRSARRPLPIWTATAVGLPRRSVLRGPSTSRRRARPGQSPMSGNLAILPHRPVVTMDILSDVFIDRTLYADLDFLDDLDAFLPSESEILRIWDPPSIAVFIADAARRHGCHMVAKLGEEGSLLAEAGTGRLIHVPALSVDVVDTTGAGDGYCGGLRCRARRWPTARGRSRHGNRCGVLCGRGVRRLATERPSADERDRRLADVLASVRPYSS